MVESALVVPRKVDEILAVPPALMGVGDLVGLGEDGVARYRWGWGWEKETSPGGEGTGEELDRPPKLEMVRDADEGREDDDDDAELKSRVKRGANSLYSLNSWPRRCRLPDSLSIWVLHAENVDGKLDGAYKGNKKTSLIDAVFPPLRRALKCKS